MLMNMKGMTFSIRKCLENSPLRFAEVTQVILFVSSEQMFNLSHVDNLSLISHVLSDRIEFLHQSLKSLLRERLNSQFLTFLFKHFHVSGISKENFFSIVQVSNQILSVLNIDSQHSFFNCQHSRVSANRTNGSHYDSQAPSAIMTIGNHDVVHKLIPTDAQGFSRHRDVVRRFFFVKETCGFKLSSLGTHRIQEIKSLSVLKDFVLRRNNSQQLLCVSSDSSHVFLKSGEFTLETAVIQRNFLNLEVHAREFQCRFHTLAVIQGDTLSFIPSFSFIVTVPVQDIDDLGRIEVSPNSVSRHNVLPFLNQSCFQVEFTIPQV